MGIHVNLAVFTDRVSDATWDEIYEKARRVTNQWTPRPLATAWRQVGAVRVAEYGLEIEPLEASTSSATRRRSRPERASRSRRGSIGMRLTSMAWDAIEVAALDELAFLYAATCTNTTRWEVHHAVRAVFENRALRCM